MPENGAIRVPTWETFFFLKDLPISALNLPLTMGILSSLGAWVAVHCAAGLFFRSQEERGGVELQALLKFSWWALRDSNPRRPG